MRLSRRRWLSILSWYLLTTGAALGGVIVEESPQTRSQSGQSLPAQGGTKVKQPYQIQNIEIEQFLSCRRVGQVTHVFANKTVTHSTDFVRCSPLPNFIN